MIKAKQDDLKVIDASLQRCTSVLSNMPRSEGNQDKVTNLIAKRISVEKKISGKIIAFEDMKLTLAEAINEIQNPLYSALLSKRYVQCKKWEDVAVELCYSKDYVMELHKKALVNLGNIFKIHEK